MDNNIQIGSNVYKVEKDIPIHDSEFVKQIQDHDLLKLLVPYRGYDSNSVQFSAKQEEILSTGLRCLKASNDPCWGYDAEKKRVTCACINGDCPSIKVCNKNYTPQYAEDWTMSEELIELYGDPEHQPIQYYYDMIPDSEMRLYEVEPKNEGYEYSTKNPVIRDEEEPETMVDPLTGRKMVVVGREWRITDTSDYQNSEIVKIWNYVEDIPVRKVVRTKKAARIEKLNSLDREKTALKEKITSDTKDIAFDFGLKETYEKNVATSISDELSIMDFSELLKPEDKCIIVVANPAERAYVSSMLMKNGLLHGFEKEDNIQIALIDEFNDCFDKDVFISSFLFKTGCKEASVKGWAKLSEMEKIVLIKVSDREYYKFEYGGNSYRWTCRDIYGIKHVCIEDADIEELDFGTDGLYPFSISDNMIISEYGDAIGGVSALFEEMINALIDSGEIETQPREIEGMFVNVKGGKHVVLGMGHLKFDEY